MEMDLRTDCFTKFRAGAITLCRPGSNLLALYVFGLWRLHIHTSVNLDYLAGNVA